MAQDRFYSTIENPSQQSCLRKKPANTNTLQNKLINDTCVSIDQNKLHLTNSFTDSRACLGLKAAQCLWGDTRASGHPSPICLLLCLQPNSFLLLVAMPGAPSSFLLLVIRLIDVPHKIRQNSLHLHLKSGSFHRTWFTARCA